MCCSVSYYVWLVSLLIEQLCVGGAADASATEFPPTSWIVAQDNRPTGLVHSVELNVLL